MLTSAISKIEACIAAPVIPPAELAHVAVQVPGTELVIVADDGTFEE